MLISIPVYADSSSGASAQTAVGVNIEDNRTYEGTKTHEAKRFFNSPGEMNYPNSPGRFDAPDDKIPGYMNMLVKDINEYDVDGQTMKAAHKMMAGGSKRVIVRPKFGPVKKEDRLPMDATMPVVYSHQDGMESVGIIIVVSDSLNSVSADVVAKAQVEAWKLGGTVMHVKVQGWQKLVHNEGTGIGFTWTGSTISGGQASAMTGVLGAGKAWGEAGYYNHPFVIIHVLRPIS